MKYYFILTFQDDKWGQTYVKGIFTKEKYASQAIGAILTIRPDLPFNKFQVKKMASEKESIYFHILSEQDEVNGKTKVVKLYTDINKAEEEARKFNCKQVYVDGYGYDKHRFVIDDFFVNKISINFD